MLILILLGTILIAGTGTILYFRPRAAKRKQYLAFRCVKCRQKVRYLSKKAGQNAMCPRCGMRCTLPTELEAKPYTEPTYAYHLRQGKKRRRITSTDRQAG